MTPKEQKKFDKLKKLVKSYGGKYVRVGYGVNAGGTRVHSFINASWHYSKKLTWEEQEEKIHQLTKLLEKDGWNIGGWKIIIGWFFSGSKKEVSL